MTSHSSNPTAHPAQALAEKTVTPTRSSTLSSYAPGLSVFPHPPYPQEASDLRQTGTVIIDVQFNANGSVSQVHVTRSSGVPILDTSTRSFIREHWRSAAYAGQTVSVPVQYILENL